MARPINVIAEEIRKDWQKVSPYAQPYLDAMRQLNSIHDSFYEDSARSVVNYFLANARGWRGEVATRVKQELKNL